MLEKENQFEFEYEGKKITAQVVDVVEEKRREIKLPVDTLLNVWDECIGTRKRYFVRMGLEYKIYCAEGGYTIATCNSTFSEWQHAETVEERNPDGTPKFTYWGGGECPVSGWIKVEIITRYNIRITGEAGIVQGWEHDKTIFDDQIIGFRILGGQKIL